jgi:ribosomal protein L32
MARVWEWVTRNQGSKEAVVAAEIVCPSCGTKRDPSHACSACGALPIRSDELRTRAEEVRDEDLEPYVTLRYIARLFKILAILLIVMMFGEVITGLLADWRHALLTLIGESTRMLVTAGFLWAGGDITILLIDAGHDLRVARILLGRINASLRQEPGGPTVRKT